MREGGAALEEGKAGRAARIGNRGTLCMHVQNRKTGGIPGYPTEPGHAERAKEDSRG